MDIEKATERYEAWLRATLPVVIEADLEYKHQQMTAGIFPFLRATFYRWAERWGQLCPHLASGPVVLGVGDLHVENYGTWRDTEGRLVWGINDLDEATNLPYPADLVRLATSASLASAGNHLSTGPHEAADTVLAGYEEGLRRGGQPFVLAEHHRELRRLATGVLREPPLYWEKLQALPEAELDGYPAAAVDTVRAAVPGQARGISVRTRRAGLGSLGRPRLVALAQWEGASVAREIKAVLPSAWDWALGVADPVPHQAEVATRSVRDIDPCTALTDRWLVRRLAPDCARIELADLPAERDETALLHSMGAELANIHLGTPDAVAAIVDDLATRSQHHPGWLASAADRMVQDTQSDWDSWRGRVGS